MEFIIDASALIAVIANGPEKEHLITLTTGALLIAPSSVHWEIGNAFSAMLRRKRITIQEAIQAIRVYATIPIRFVDIELAEAVQLAGQYRLYS
jgi:predicted nucleic acid-binding protein